MDSTLFTPPPAPPDAMQELWQMHDQTMQALQRIETLLQRLLDAQTATAGQTGPQQATPR